MAGESKKAGWAAALSAIVATIALGATLYFNYKNDERADRQDERLERQEAAQTQQEREQFANKVMVGEAPQYFYDTFGSPPANTITWVVINASSTQLNGVWVEGRNGSTVRINGIQRCTMYSLEPGFDPVGVHFKDPNDSWFRPVDGDLTHAYRPMPDTDTSDSPEALEVENCGG